MTVFKEDGATKLSSSYLPEKLPHRTQHVNELLELFKPLLNGERQIPWSIVIQGPSGTGKTTVVKAFLKIVNEISRKRNLKVMTDIINCRFISSDFFLAQAMASKVMPNIPLRGFSANEIVRNVSEYLRSKESYLILALDDFDTYVMRLKSKARLVYDIIKSQEVEDFRIYLIFVGITDYTLMIEDDWIRNYVWLTKSKFSPYNWKELKDILGERAKEAFKEEAIGEEEIVFASRISSKFGYGSARYGLELLLLSGMEADWENSERIKPEHIRTAQARLEGKKGIEEIKNMEKEALNFLSLLKEAFEEGDPAYLELKNLSSKLRVDEKKMLEIASRLDFEGIVDLLEEENKKYIGLFLPVKSLGEVK